MIKKWLGYFSKCLLVPQIQQGPASQYTIAKSKIEVPKDVRNSNVRKHKTSSGEIGLDIRPHASPKVGQDQVSGGVGFANHFVKSLPLIHVLFQLTDTAMLISEITRFDSFYILFHGTPRVFTV